MLVKDFPGCCSAKILCDFGGTATSFARTGKVEKEKLLKELIRAVSWLG